jgi:hypothetical protein
VARQRDPAANAQGRAVDATDACQLAAAEVEGRRQIVEYLRFLRAEVPGFEAAEIVEIAPQVGVRETRRVRGAYSLSGEDVLAGARFDDSIGLNAWPIEQHAAGRIEWAFARDPDNSFNQLPWRMLVPQAPPTCWSPAAAPAWSTWARAPHAPAAPAS